MEDGKELSSSNPEGGKGLSSSNPPKINKYACACAIVASVISIIFGYGNSHDLIFLLNITYDRYVTCMKNIKKFVPVCHFLEMQTRF